MSQLRGWSRIGIVLSILWSVLVLSFAGVEYYQMSAERNKNLTLPAPSKGFVVDTKTDSIFFKWSPVNLLAKDTGRYIRGFQFKSKLFLLVWALPIILCWSIAYVFIVTIKWINAGFKKSKGNGS